MSGIYSSGKRLLEEEKNAVVPPQLVEQTLGSEQLTEKARAAEAILKALDPLLKTREKQQQQITVLCKAIDNYGGHLETLVSEFHDIRNRLQDLIDLKSPNAQKEAIMLDKLIAILP